MTHLGELGGEARPAVDVTFGFFGEEFRAHPDLGELVLVEFLEGAMKIDEHSAHALTAVKDFLRQVVDPADFDRFWQLAMRGRATTQQLMTLAERLIEKIVEAETGRPTSLPSDSSDGQSTTEARSEDDASSRVVRRLELAGRPDLAMAVELAGEAGQARSTG